MTHHHIAPPWTEPPAVAPGGTETEAAGTEKTHTTPYKRGPTGGCGGQCHKRGGMAHGQRWKDRCLLSFFYRRVMRSKSGEVRYGWGSHTRILVAGVASRTTVKRSSANLHPLEHSITKQRKRVPYAPQERPGNARRYCQNSTRST